LPRQRRGEHRVQQRARFGLGQALDEQLRQSHQVVTRRARREHQADRFCLQATRNEREDLRRGAIKPLLVIDQADQRPLLGHVRQQTQHRQPDQETIRRRPRTDAERRLQRIALRTWEALNPIQHRPEQLVQPGESQLHLRLHTGGTLHTAARRSIDQVVQQRRLAHARIAAHHQHPTLAGASSFDEPVEHVALAAPTP
jgi:hypothetical protein